MRTSRMVLCALFAFAPRALDTLAFCALGLLSTGLLAPGGLAAQAQSTAALDAGTVDVAEDDRPWALDHRRYNTREGSSGGLFLSEPGSGELGSVRLQLVLDTFPEDDFLREGEPVGQARQALSLGFTPWRHTELFAALLGSGTSTVDPDLGSLHTQAAVAGVKLFSAWLAPLHLGGDVRFVLRNELGGQLPLLKATSIGLRAAGSVDLHDTELKLPLRVRMNLDYLFDNSALTVEDLEDARYEALSRARPFDDETRQRVSRIERYAFGISRVDTLTVGLGLEAPVAVGDDTFLHPLIEWRLGMPINRRGFDCAVEAGDDGAGSPRADTDDCLSEAGVASWPSQLAIGLRLAPPVRGFSLSLAADIGLTGTSHFAHETAPVSPFSVMIGLSYGYDAQPARAAETPATPILLTPQEESAPAPEPAPPALPMLDPPAPRALDALPETEPVPTAETAPAAEPVPAAEPAPGTTPAP